MADRIVVLNRGMVEQVGSPLDLYHHPANLFVAGFIGSPKMNFFSARVTGHPDSQLMLALDGGEQVLVPAPPTPPAIGTELTLGVRPEHLQLADQGALSGLVDVVEHLGVETLVYVRTAAGSTIVARADDLSRVRTGETVNLALRPGRASLFDASGAAVFHAVPQ